MHPQSPSGPWAQVRARETWRGKSKVSWATRNHSHVNLGTFDERTNGEFEINKCRLSDLLLISQLTSEDWPINTARKGKFFCAEEKKSKGIKQTLSFDSDTINKCLITN